VLTKCVLVGFLALSAMMRPVAGDAKEQICLCEFVAPQYSMIARTAQIEGSVTVKVKVGADGTITEVWPPGTVVTPAGDIVQSPSASANDNYLAGVSVAALKKWRFCPGPVGREINIVFVYKLTEPGSKGWTPTEVSFHASAVVEISTARILPSAMSQTDKVTSGSAIGR
jgi:hypothetical protein